MSEGPVSFEMLDGAEEVAARAADVILSAADSAICGHGHFHLVLVGGRMPLAAYARLVGAAADWDRWHNIFFGDERFIRRRALPDGR